MRRLVALSWAAPTLYITHANTPTQTHRRTHKQRPTERHSAAVNWPHVFSCTRFELFIALLLIPPSWKLDIIIMYIMVAQQGGTCSLLHCDLTVPQFGPQVQHVEASRSLMFPDFHVFGIQIQRSKVLVTCLLTVLVFQSLCSQVSSEYFQSHVFPGQMFSGWLSVVVAVTWTGHMFFFKMTKQAQTGIQLTSSTSFDQNEFRVNQVTVSLIVEGVICMWVVYEYFFPPTFLI